MLKSLFRKITCLSVVLGLTCSLLGFSVSAVSVNVTAISQNQPHWCWAACDQMSAMIACPAYYHNQNNIVYHFFGDYNDHSADISLAANGASYGSCYYKTFTGYNSTLSYSQLYSKISAGYPVQAGLLYYSSGIPTNSGHMVEIYEVYTFQNNNFVEYINPTYGSRQVKTYSTFCNNNVSTGYKYIETVY